MSGGPAVVAFAALVLQLGATPVEADAMLVAIGDTQAPASPSEAVEQVRAALDRVRATSDL